VKDRDRGRPLELVTSDDYPAYETALLKPTGGGGDHGPATEPQDVPDKPAPGIELCHVEKRREKGRW